MSAKVSLKTIANEVGVSTALVSYVLNGKMENRIGKDVAARIREVAGRHNYRPNHLARSLKTSKSATIGLIVADILNPFSSALTHIVADEASRQGYSVIFGSANESTEEFARLIEVFSGRQVDGLILLAPEGSEAALRSLIDRRIPFVLLDRYFKELSCNAVILDNHAASFQAAHKLINAGAKRIGLIGYETSLLHLNQREQGYRDAVAGAGFEPDPRWVRRVHSGNEEQEVREAMNALLQMSPAPDALIFTSNLITVAALKILNQLSDSVTNQLRLVGFDETEVYDFFKPGLSYVHQPIDEFGRVAVELLLKNMTGDHDAECVLLQPRLMKRG